MSENQTTPSDHGLQSVPASPFTKSFIAAHFPRPPRDREDRRPLDPKRPEKIDLDPDPAKDEALPDDMDPLTFTKARLQQNKELLTIKKAVGRASKENHYSQIESRIKTFLGTLKDSKHEDSIRRQLKNLTEKVNKSRYDLTQKRRLRRVVKKHHQRHLR